MYHSPLLDSREVKKNYHPLLSHFLKQAFKNQAIKQPWFLFLNLSLSTDFLHMLMSIFWTFSLWLEISLWFKIDFEFENQELSSCVNMHTFTTFFFLNSGSKCSEWPLSVKIRSSRLEESAWLDLLCVNLNCPA